MQIGDKLLTANLSLENCFLCRNLDVISTTYNVCHMIPDRQINPAFLRQPVFACIVISERGLQQYRASPIGFKSLVRNSNFEFDGFSDMCKIFFLFVNFEESGLFLDSHSKNGQLNKS